MKAAKYKTILNASGYSPRSYSGRGMYGKECVGIVTEQRLTSALAELILGCEDLDQAAELVERVATDNMGRDSIILYWPHIKWSDYESGSE